MPYNAVVLEHYSSSTVPLRFNLFPYTPIPEFTGVRVGALGLEGVSHCCPHPALPIRDLALECSILHRVDITNRAGHCACFYGALADGPRDRRLLLHRESIYRCVMLALCDMVQCSGSSLCVSIPFETCSTYQLTLD